MKSCEVELRPASGTLLRLRDVTKTYNPGQPDELVVLEEISLDVEEHSMVVLKGPSGSGKTSLLSLIGCMSRPTAGSIELHGRDIAKLPERFLSILRRSKYGFIFQQFNLLRDVSVFDNVLLPLFPSALPYPEMRDRALGILAEMKLEHRKKLPVRKLSGGEQQRVAIARALVTEPEIVIADEPTAHLDAELADDMMETLCRLQKGGTTVIIATHDPFVYEYPGVDAVVTMQNGRIRDSSGP